MVDKIKPQNILRMAERVELNVKRRLPLNNLGPTISGFLIDILNCSSFKFFIELSWPLANLEMHMKRMPRKNGPFEVRTQLVVCNGPRDAYEICLKIHSLDHFHVKIEG